MSKYVGFRLGKVHESHVISEYYCGRCGYPVTDHDSFCPECGGAFRECDASNLEDENAKLRELLLEIAKLVTNPYGGCLRPGCAHGCPHHLECDEELHTCFYVDRMRELGVEVE